MAQMTQIAQIRNEQKQSYVQPKTSHPVPGGGIDFDAGDFAAGFGG